MALDLPNLSFTGQVGRNLLRTHFQGVVFTSLKLHFQLSLEQYTAKFLALKAIFLLLKVARVGPKNMFWHRITKIPIFVDISYHDRQNQAI